jgi:hypothetical protein
VNASQSGAVTGPHSGQSAPAYLQDLGPDDKPPQWGENLALSLPLGLLSSASLPARRGALRSLLAVLLAREQALLRQVLLNAAHLGLATRKHGNPCAC